MNWTPNQQRAIEIVGRDVLVSAGAGSGKTAVLSERCAHLVAGVRPVCPVDRLLVVTFTEAAADEMRLRIRRALRARLDQRNVDRNWIAWQLALLDVAPISTLHAFCRRTLARFFTAAGVDPGFSVLDGHESAILREETAKALFEELSTGDGALGSALDELCHLYGGGSHERIRALVLSLNHFLESTPDPDLWIANVRRRFEAVTPASLSDDWRGERRSLLRDHLDRLSDAAGRIAHDFAGEPGAHPWVQYAADCLEEFTDWRRALVDGIQPDALDALCSDIRDYAVPRAPASTKKVQQLPAAELAAFDAARDAVGRFREELK
ncbi:MAG: UvrD-helicase domain-containing protein [Phycisphaerae bacterium]